MKREEFLEWARQEIVAPRTMEGHQPRNEEHYWTGLVSRGIYFAVDALENGKLRVHLYTSDDEIKQRWSAQLRTAQPLPVSHSWTSPLGPRDNGRGKRAYLGFEWETTPNNYSREQQIVMQTAGWLDQFYPTA